MKKPFRLNRRAVLRGACAAVSLPLLEAMIPVGKSAFAATARPVRMIGYYVPNGIHMQSWTPPDQGENYTMTPTLQPLAELRDSFMVLSNLHNLEGRAIQVGDHAAGTGAFLSCYQVRKDLGDNIENRTTVDQVAAQQIGHLTPLPSLELGMFGGGSTGNCDSGYSCVYTRNISWSGPRTPMPKLVEPQQVFDRLFSSFQRAGGSAADIERRNELNKSLLDYVADDIHRLQQRLGQNDRAKLDEYFTSIRQVESQLVQEVRPSQACEFPERPGGGLTLTEKAHLMSDLMVLAFQCDLTRVATFMMGNGVADTRFDFLGIPEGHHYLSHHAGRQSYYDRLKVIDKWEMEQFAYLLTRLKNTTDPEGNNLLFSTQAFLSSDISDGNAHNHNNMPVLLAGRANGYLASGRHVRYPSAQSYANLFMVMLDTMGTPVESIGDSTGRLPNVRA